ncbi:DUF1553 domain-containing protein [Algoriphagus aestuariicola]|uniref:DUF1553 domain-containing protein n=1 Tax=Algoriphagus aestuariicola TaxID=1852016 RepID=A0ABS3BSF6_9BACT|nr:DUF1553 domain-containing protein [Algoriphagus aestuariicola]MBN7801201.1 DUF1553 domain-containing protein [Algoriphagus aestuariicola]
MKSRVLSLLCLLFLFFSCSPELPEEVQLAYEELPEALDFNIHVKPILSDKCFACHGPDLAAQKAGLSLHDPEMAFAGLKESPGKFAIKPGNLNKSELFHRIISEDPEYRMPSIESNLTLSPREKAILIKWIEDGAEYKPHWAFIPPQARDLPKVKAQAWAKNPIDRFVLAKLEGEKIQPSPEADKEILLRRLSLDLTGLPPTLAEMDAFLADASPDAYEKQVNRLLDSPHYGEKMAMHWMDIARFADTHGYTVDRYRDASPYRDWMINAYNQNLPYDQFIRDQLAGDLLPNPTKDQLIATAFNRIHPQNMEGGIVEEEFRVEYVVDRTSTMGQAFMALTLGCARCHDHKYDPISQKNFFELSSFFNQVDEAGQISWDDAMPAPTMLLTDAEKDRMLAYLLSQKESQEAALEQVAKEQEAAFQAWLDAKAYQKEANREFPASRVAFYSFDQNSIQNQLNPAQKGTMESSEVKNQVPRYVEGLRGKGVRLNGDMWLDLGGSGVFSKSEPFSVSIWVNIPEALTHGAIFHKGSGAVLYNWRGYHLSLKDSRLELLMAHTAPYNAITKVTEQDIPRDQWVNLVMTYDGSSKAKGLKVYLNGTEMPTQTTYDNLYKDILFKGAQPGLQVGAVWRGKGLKDALVDEVSVYNMELSPLEIRQISSPEVYKSTLGKGADQFTASEKQDLKKLFLNNHSSAYREKLKAVIAQRKTYSDSVEVIPEMMIMQDKAEKRPTYILTRGEYNLHGEEVFPNTPESVLPMKAELPRNRLGLAKWLTSPENPLTARVAVNRFWQNYFGKGLVATSGDFGNQGQLPSHPELLDWLALEFQRSGWDVKAMQRLIVTSATYRQASNKRPELEERDADNTLLARGPAVRLPAELIRDNALAASGLLNPEIGGKSVFPYQPEGLWRVNGGNYVQSKGENLYRRSLYTIWKRSVHHPTMAIFDAPDHSVSVSKRQETNTPLQALALLNDPTFVEASKVLGEQMMAYPEISEAIKTTFRKLIGRNPHPKELEILLDLRENEFRKFTADGEKLKGWLETGEYTISPDLDPVQVAANAVTASVIINSDAALTKR